MSIARSLLIFSICSMAGNAFADGLLPAPLMQIWQQSALPDQAMGLRVQEVGAASPEIDWNASQPMQPASIMKVLTSVAALDTLKPGYRWQTAIYAENEPERGVLRGDLYLKGNGDPALVIERFWLLLTKLRARGVQTIEGNLIADRSAFESMEFDASEFDQAPERPYNAAANALLLNYDALGLTLSPDASLRMVAQMPMKLTVANRVKLVNGECGDWKNRLHADFKERDGGITLVASGQYAHRCGEKNWQLYPYQISRNAWLGAVFAELWHDLGGRWHGKVGSGATPEHAQMLASAQSPTLAEALRDMNKFSNNVMARQVYLTFGAVQNGQAASWERSQLALKSWLQAHDLEPVINENGAGLSRRDRISAQQMMQILLYAWRAPYMAEFVASLAVPGEEGTLVHRNFADAHLKTGSLEGVRTLAGYVHAKNGRTYALVLMVNHADAARAVPFQDALVQWLAKLP